MVRSKSKSKLNEQLGARIMKQLKTVTRCNMCPYLMKYSGGYKECGYANSIVEIENGKKIDARCELPKDKTGKYRVAVIDRCFWCPHWEQGYTERETGYRENICHKYKKVNIDWYSKIPSFCKLKDYVIWLLW